MNSDACCGDLHSSQSMQNQDQNARHLLAAATGRALLQAVPIAYNAQQFDADNIGAKYEQGNKRRLLDAPVPAAGTYKTVTLGRASQQLLPSAKSCGRLPYIQCSLSLQTIKSLKVSKRRLTDASLPVAIGYAIVTFDKAAAAAAVTGSDSLPTCQGCPQSRETYIGF